MEAKRYYSLDALKFSCAICIVFIHFEILYTEYINFILRCAVPCFAMCSGFFFYKENNRYKTLQIIKKIAGIYVFATFVYALWQYIQWRTLSPFVNRSSIINFIVWGNNPFAMHLWYLHCYIYALLIILILEKYNRFKQVIYWMPLLLLPNFLLGSYSICFEPTKWQDCIYSRNAYFLILPYFSIGYILRNTLIRYKYKVKKNGLICIALILSIVSYLDITFACNGIINDLPITSALLSVVLFVMFLLMKMKQNTISTLGSKYSLNLYIYHPLFGGILSFILLRLGVPGGAFGLPYVWQLILPLGVCLLTISILMLFTTIKVKLYNGRIKNS